MTRLHFSSPPTMVFGVWFNLLTCLFLLRFFVFLSSLFEGDWKVYIITQLK